MTAGYGDVDQFIAGRWRPGTGGSETILNPATEQPLATLSHASKADLDDALAATQSGFATWRAMSAFERSKIMRGAAYLLRGRVEQIARLMTLEQGKPLAQARAETLAAGDIIDWFAEEARRAYGRVIPPRSNEVMQLVIKEPVGPVAAFCPWNFPINQAVRKISGALAAGCSIIVKGPEETPASCAELVRAFADAGVPAGVVQLVYGSPPEISAYLIPHPVIRKVTFTGSTPVGKQLAGLAGLHMKRVTMELGGHAPALVFEDADIGKSVEILAANKFRNGGQVCVAPTRFLIQGQAYAPFVDRFVAAAEALKVGDGLDPASQMGPLANARRLDAMEALVEDAVSRGARLLTGGKRIGNQGYFFEPTVLADTPLDARIQNEEPFGPVALVSRFDSLEQALTEANRLDFGLAAYAYTDSQATARRVGLGIESGMVSINHHGLGLPETPFGGIKDSGYGSEGGSEAIEAYLNTKFISLA